MEWTVKLAFLDYTGARSTSFYPNRVRWPWFFPQARYVDAKSPGASPYRVRAALTSSATRNAKSASAAGVADASTIAVTSLRASG